MNFDLRTTYNFRMRAWAFCVAFCLLCALAEARPQCAKWGPRPDFFIQSVHFAGLNGISPEERKAIARPVIGKCLNSGDEDEVGVRIMAALQEHGFFKATIAELRLTVGARRRRPLPADVAVDVHPGLRYRLEDISFTGGKVFPENQLRPLFQIAPGEVFDTEKIRLGLEALRKLYGQHGYIRFTPVPDTQIDDNRRTIRLKIDLDEGDQFRVAKVSILAPQDIANRLYAGWPLKPGDIYSPHAIDQFATENRALLPRGWDPENGLERTIDSQTKTITIRISACPPKYVCPFDLQRLP